MSLLSETPQNKMNDGHRVLLFSCAIIRIYILFEYGGWSHFEMKATECDIQENEKNQISQNADFTSLL